MAESLSTIERIKQKLDIVEEIGAVVQLRKSGKSFKGLCPFHDERTPSFYVMPETGTWKCFGCGEGGDIFTFVEKQQALDFRDALTLLAEKAGVSLDGGGSYDGHAEEPLEASARKRLRALNETAAIWFHSQLLQAQEAQYARAYLDSRGVSSESIAHWRLGYAPDGEKLSRYLLEQGYSVKELVEAGLTRERDGSKGGGVYDYFRNRLIFPIRDVRGHTIAFGGRELGGGTPKYLNTPQTVLFDKSATLYGLDLARDGIRRANQVVFVEGYMDAVVPHQYGFRNVVAVIGSAITEKHIRQIKKMTRRVVLALDPDAAGEAATMRGILVAQDAFDRKVELVAGQENWSKHLNPDQLHDSAALGRAVARGYESIRGQIRFEERMDAEIRVMSLPPHEDPDEFVRRDPEGWKQAVEQAQPLIDHVISVQTADLDISIPREKVEAARRLLPIIAEVKDRTTASEYLGRVAVKLRLDKTDLERDLVATRQKLDREAHAQPPRRDREQQDGSEGRQEEAVELVGEKYRESGQTGPSPSYSSTGAASTTALSGMSARLRAEQAQEEYCLGLLLDYPTVWSEVYGILGESDFAGTETRALFSAYAAAVRSNASFDPNSFLADLPPVLVTVAQRARDRVTVGEPPEGQGLSKAASSSAYRLKRTRLKEEMAELDYLQRDAEQSGDGEALRALLRRKQHLLSQRRAIDAASGLFG